MLETDTRARYIIKLHFSKNFHFQQPQSNLQHFFFLVIVNLPTHEYHSCYLFFFFYSPVKRAKKMHDIVSTRSSCLCCGSLMQAAFYKFYVSSLHSSAVFFSCNFVFIIIFVMMITNIASHAHLYCFGSFLLAPFAADYNRFHFHDEILFVWCFFYCIVRFDLDNFLVRKR